jgi:hypothetical protein
MLPDFLSLVFHIAKKLVFILVLVLPVMAFPQSKKHPSLKNLKTDNGFNGITLGADVSELTGKLAYLDGNSRVDADSCLRYVYNDQELLKIDTDLRLDGIGLRAYKDKIVDIYLFFRMNDSYKLLSKFLKDYGQFTDKPHEYEDIYNWNTGPVTLSLKYAAQIDMGIAVYTNNPLMKEVAAAREVRDLRTARVAAAQLQANKMRDSIDRTRRVILRKVPLEDINSYQIP